MARWAVISCEDAWSYEEKDRCQNFKATLGEPKRDPARQYLRPVRPDRALALALTHYESGNPEAAQLLCRQVLDTHPEHPEALHLMGLFARDAGSPAEALKFLRRAVARRPDHAEYHTSLGTTLAALGRIEEAVPSFRQALKLDPASGLAFAHLGQMLLTLKRYEDAAVVYRRLVKLSPDNVEAYTNLASAEMALGRLRGAEVACRNVVRLRPSSADAHANLGAVLAAQGRIEAPLRCFGQALRLQPDKLEFRRKMGWFLLWLGRLDEAERCFRQVLSRDAGDVDAAAGVASTLERRGDFRTALSVLRPYVRRAQESANLCICFATLCQRLGQPAEAIPVLETVTRLPNRPHLESARLWHAYGEVLEATESYHEAFEAHRRANRYRGGGFNTVKHSDYVSRLIETFHRDWARELPAATNRSERPVFVVGMPRSGTTLVEQILATHPWTYGAGELESIRRIAVSIAFRMGVDDPYPMSLSAVDDRTLDAMAGWYLEQLDQVAGGAIRVVDKMPFNFLHLGLISMLFPEARIIHCVRDPLDTALSCFFQNFSASYAFTNSLETLGCYYRDYQRLMRHWHEVLPLSILDLRYEQLVSAPEQSMRQLVQFLGLEWDDRVLDFHENPRLVTTASYDQVRRPIYTGSVGRAQRFKAQLGPLEAAIFGESPRVIASGE